MRATHIVWTSLAALLTLVLSTSTPQMATAKEAKPPAKEPPKKGSFEVLSGGPIEFLAPEGWTEAVKSRRPTSAAYVSKSRDGLIAIQVLPQDAALDKAAAGGIIRQLIEKKKKAKQEIVMEPKVEADPRYELKIHEKYRSPGEKTADTFYLYRKIGTVVTLTTVSSLAEGDDGKKIHEAGEGVATSIRMSKPAAKGK